MDIQRRRDKFLIELTQDELVFLVSFLGRKPESAEDEIKATEFIKEFARFSVKDYLNRKQNSTKEAQKGTY